MKKYHFQQIGNHFPQCINTPDLICAFIWNCFGLSKEVCNSFLTQRAQKWQLVKVGSAKKPQFYLIEGTFFCTSNFDQLPFLTPLRQKKVTYHFRKGKTIPIESSNENWNSSIHSVQKVALTKSGTFSFKSVLLHCGWSFSCFYS